jgi:hypothetical protein
MIPGGDAREGGGELATRYLCIHSCGAPVEWLYTTRVAASARPRNRAAQDEYIAHLGAARHP